MNATSSAVRAAVTDLAEALAAVESVAKRVTADIGAALNALPAVIIGPPALVFDGFGSATDATFLVYVVVTANGSAIPALWDLVPPIAAALDESNGVVRRADPGVWTAGTVDLPCYEITVEYPL